MLNNVGKIIQPCSTPYERSIDFTAHFSLLQAVVVSATVQSYDGPPAVKSLHVSAWPPACILQHPVDK